MSKLTLKIQLKFDDIEGESGEFKFTTNGKQNITITVEDEYWLDEYESNSEVEQSLIITQVIGDYIDIYTKFMIKLYDLDEEYVQDNISVAIDEELKRGECDE